MAESNKGRIVQVIGPVLDIKFEEGSLPNLLNAIVIDNHGKKLVAETAQHIGDDIIRCIAMDHHVVPTVHDSGRQTALDRLRKKRRVDARSVRHTVREIGKTDRGAQPALDANPYHFERIEDRKSVV